MDRNKLMMLILECITDVNDNISRSITEAASGSIYAFAVKRVEYQLAFRDGVEYLRDYIVEGLDKEEEA